MSIYYILIINPKSNSFVSLFYFTISIINLFYFTISIIIVALMSSRVNIVARDLKALQEDFSQDRALRNDSSEYFSQDRALRNDSRWILRSARNDKLFVQNDGVQSY